MANLGNAWHIPTNPQPQGRSGMRDPIGAVVPGTAVTIFSGNQFQGGGGNPGNQLQVGSSVLFKRSVDATWTPVPMVFQSAAGNDKFYSATIPAGTFQVGDIAQYYLRIPYSDHDTTFVRANGNASATEANEAAARAAPFTFAVESSATWGQWGPVFTLPNVAIHASVLPNGRVLMWGRRIQGNASLDVHECTPFVWDPTSGTTTNTPQPALADGTKVNLFCSGHTFLPDGRLLVAGGHLSDGEGVNQAALYDGTANTWSATATMNNGRWYPTATSLPDGSILVTAGSYHQNGQPSHNVTPQVWNNGTWTSLADFPNGAFDLYPRMHMTSNGQVFMSGSLKQTYLLTVSGGGQWTPLAPRDNATRDYAPSVMYDANKVIYIGGGGGFGQPPTAQTETIDLSAAHPQWQNRDPMHFPRRQHNATLLPDGTVLVTGGTRGVTPDPALNGDNGFNDLQPGHPVHTAELWDPKTGKWTQLLAEEMDRCYHSTAVLLPDATVLSAGGGEYRPVEAVDAPNNPQDSHSDGQIYSPPYLFKGARPTITAAPPAITLGQPFSVATPQPNDIRLVSLVRLSSVTHAQNMNQRIVFLQSQVAGAGLTLTAPASANVCPPGHYMLFLVNSAGVPSVARVLQVQAAAAPVTQPHILSLSAESTERGPHVDLFERRTAVHNAAKGTAVVVGILGTCPYGIAACWGGAYEALASLDAVDLVNPVPNAVDSTAEVFLQDERLPPLNEWEEQFQSFVSGRYVLRGVEVTLRGSIEHADGKFVLSGNTGRPAVQLAPLAPTNKIQWDRPAARPKPLDPTEVSAYARLADAVPGLAPGRELTVTGPLKQSGAAYRLEVRAFSA